MVVSFYGLGLNARVRKVLTEAQIKIVFLLHSLLKEIQE
jgi:hypothetical protein